MKNEKVIQQGLDTCFKTAYILKDKFPNELMKITKNTIIVNSVKNSRLLGGRRGMSNMSNTYAYYSRSSKRIVVKQKTFTDKIKYSTYGGKHSLSIIPPYKKYVDLYRYTAHGGALLGRKKLEGNWALVDLMCHEFAHHRTRGHGKGFKVKYHRFLNYMVNKVISGEYYT